MKKEIPILFCFLFISLHGMVLKAQDTPQKMAGHIAEPNTSKFKVAGPEAGANKLVAPDGLIDRLPPDGTWARFKADDALVTIASVGKIIIAEEPCRWIEVIIEQGGRALIWKLLIQEKCLRKGRNILEQALSVWRCEEQEDPLNITGMNSSIGEFGPLIFMLIGPDQEIRSLSPQVVETTLGRIECAGRSGRRLMIFDQREVDVTYRQWVHESAPFGVLRSEMKSSIKFDGQTMQAKTSITQVDVGTGARSRILTGNQSVEELTAKPFAPAGSWQWAIVPARFNWSSMGNRGLAMTINKEDEQVRFMLAYQASKDAMYRPVAFDADQRRYEFQSRNSVASGTVGLAAFTLAQDVLPTGEIKYIGVEKSSQEIRKEPPSLVGKSLPDFSNIGFNFVPKRADEKAILICFFDINQRPSRNCIMQLTKEAQELKAKDIVVIAVQASMIDENKLNEWIKKCNIPFPVGMIEGDEEKIRFIWGVRSLPWLILTDKKHIVQAEGFSINELDERIATLIDNNTAALSYQYQFLLFLEELIDFSECKLRLLL